MTRLFENVPVEDDTTIISEQLACLGEYDVLYQKWCWDGITAESFIFINDDVLKLDDVRIEKIVRDSPMCDLGSGVTIKRTDLGFVFVNFNFRTE
ncbi:MAG: hypothetical protein ABGY11_12755 [Candidatus Thioglobus sp.]|jgi:hypothetical protein